MSTRRRRGKSESCELGSADFVNGVSIKITLRNDSVDMQVNRTSSPDTHSSCLLPPIIPSDSISTSSRDSQGSSQEARRSSRYHSDCKKSPGQKDEPSRKKGDQQERIRRRENIISKYLDNTPDYLDRYVLEHVNADVIELWHIRKTTVSALWFLKQDAIKSNVNIHTGDSKFRTITKSFRLNVDTDPTKLLQTTIEAYEQCETIADIQFELAYIIAMAIATDDFTTYHLTDNNLKVDVIVGSRSDKPVRCVKINPARVPDVLNVAIGRIVRRINVDPSKIKVDEDNQKKNREAPFRMLIPVDTGSHPFVVELHRFSTKFYKEDEELATTLMIWAILFFKGNLENLDLRKQSKLQKYMGGVAKSIFQDIGSMETLVEKIMHFAQKLVNADRTSLFLVDSNTKELYATVFDVGVEPTSGCSGKAPREEIRFPIGVGIAGYVAKTGETLNIPDAYQDERFNSTVDQKTGYRTKTILCMPVYSKNTIIGVVQMVNKKDDDKFTTSDVDAFKTFAVYCGLALHNNKLYNRIKRSEQKYKVALEVLSYHNTCNEEEVKLATADIALFNIEENIFAFSPFQISEYEKALSVVNMFTSLFKLENFDQSVLARFALTVKKNYRRVPYHNWTHGYAVCNTMFNILMRHDKRFTENERLALFIGSLCHDLDHRGKNNKFMLDSASPLAAMYSTSTLEHHHFNQAVIILQQDDHNIFSNLSNSEYKQVLSLLKHCILATDLAAFFPNKEKLHSLLATQQFNWNNQDHRLVTLALTMTGADLSASAKPWDVQANTVQVIFQEFYDQGDAERAAGRAPLPMMDRNRPDEQPTSQVGFLTSICLPCYEILQQLIPQTKPLYDMCISNLNKWKFIEMKVRKYCQTEHSQEEIFRYVEMLINYGSEDIEADVLSVTPVELMPEAEKIDKTNSDLLTVCRAKTIAGELKETQNSLRSLTADDIKEENDGFGSNESAVIDIQNTESNSNVVNIKDEQDFQWQDEARALMKRGKQ